ncbi:MAG TPA: hypothetical protein ENN34_12980 [Deltaproteobacteria bacterium]|mgnify:CR=1 FL=1|nr:hypothetical protein [Deltaproteobacteria bacterium]
MIRQSFYRRIVFPVALILITMIIALNGYDVARRIESRVLHALVVNVSLILMVLSIWCGAMIANTLAYFRGASFGERLFVSMFTPVVFLLKQWLGIWGIYSFAEFLFLLFHHVVLSAVIINLIGMGLSELWCRIIDRVKNRDPAVKVVQKGNAVVLLLGAGLFTLMFWHFGHFYYYLFMEAYIRLFL